MLERLAQELPGRVVVVPWAQTVSANRDLVTGDGVHATSQGYQQRAQLYAQAIQSCL
jgi:lysophospholipase L1-like esterase